MKTVSLSIILFLCTLLCIAQNQDQRDLGSFSAVKVSQSIEVELIPGNRESITLELSNIDPEDVLTEVSRNQLVIKLASGNYRNVNVKAKLYYRSLDHIEVSSSAKVYTQENIKTKNDFSAKASSSGNLKLKDVSAKSAEVAVSSSGKIDMAELKADHLKADASSSGKMSLAADINSFDAKVSSSGKISISGSSPEQRISASSSGKIDAYDLEGDDISADVSSSGKASIHAKNSLNASASSGGKISYKGSPDKEKVTAKSGGKVSKH